MVTNLCGLLFRSWCVFVHWKNQKMTSLFWSCKYLYGQLCVIYSSIGIHNASTFRSKLHTYDDVVERVAEKLGLDDPSKLRLTSHNCYSQQPKPQPIKYRGVDHLSDMLVHYNQVIDVGLSELTYSFFDFNA